jgi:hypothetical protein
MLYKIDMLKNIINLILEFYLLPSDFRLIQGFLDRYVH